MDTYLNKSDRSALRRTSKALNTLYDKNIKIGLKEMKLSELEKLVLRKEYLQKKYNKINNEIMKNRLNKNKEKLNELYVELEELNVEFLPILETLSRFGLLEDDEYTPLELKTGKSLLWL
jgi:hypothetical protein